MDLIIGFVVIVFICMVILYWLNKKDSKKKKTMCMASSVLYDSCNRNSYTEARKVFKVLKNAELNPNFLGGHHE